LTVERCGGAKIVGWWVGRSEPNGREQFSTALTQPDWQGREEIGRRAPNPGANFVITQTSQVMCSTGIQNWSTKTGQEKIRRGCHSGTDGQKGEKQRGQFIQSKKLEGKKYHSKGSEFCDGKVQRKQLEFWAISGSIGGSSREKTSRKTKKACPWGLTGNSWQREGENLNKIIQSICGMGNSSVGERRTGRKRTSGQKTVGVRE